MTDRLDGKNWEIINAHSRAKLACERIAAVVNGKMPDRVPFLDHYWPEFAERYRDERGLPPDTSMAELFDHDAIILAPSMGPWPGDAGALDHEPDGYIYRRDEYGLVTRAARDKQSMPQHVDSKIKERSDLDQIPFEDPEDPGRSAELERQLPEVCTRFCPILKLGGPFSRSWRLRGMVKFLEDMGTDELFVQEMVSRITDHLIAVGQSVAKRLEWPRIQLHIADDFAATNAPLFSPTSYERIFLPNLKKMVDVFHAMGFKISYESEGNVRPMLELLDESGIDGLAYMEPRSGMHLEEIREQFGDRFFLLGNICNTAALPSGDPKTIAREVHRVLSACRDGHYMGLSAHSIGPDISSDAYDCFFDLMKRYAKYPMVLDGLLE